MPLRRYVCVFLSVRMSACMSVRLRACLSVCSSAWSVCPSVGMSLCMYVGMYVCAYVSIYRSLGRSVDLTGLQYALLVRALPPEAGARDRQPGGATREDSHHGKISQRRQVSFYRLAGRETERRRGQARGWGVPSSVYFRVNMRIWCVVSLCCVRSVFLCLVGIVCLDIL